MNNGLKEFIKTAREVRLSREEKTAMRSMLLRYTKEHPAKHAVAHRSVLSPFSLADIRTKKVASGIAIGALLFGGSTSFAAESALPGDVLYSVKTHVNEPVRGAVAFSPQAKAVWEVRLVERRLEEVEKLAVASEVKDVMQVNIKQYTDQVHQRIADFDKDGDEEDAIQTAGNLSTMLREHENTISALATQSQAVAGAVATSTVATTSTPSGAMMPMLDTGATSTTPFARHRDRGALDEVLHELRAVRGHAEERHHELEHKYHPEMDENKTSDLMDATRGTDSEDVPAETKGAPRLPSPHREHSSSMEKEMPHHVVAPLATAPSASVNTIATSTGGGYLMTNIMPTISSFLSGHKNEHYEEFRVKANDNLELRGASGDRQKDAHRSGENTNE